MGIRFFQIHHLAKFWSLFQFFIQPTFDALIVNVEWRNNEILSFQLFTSFNERGQQHVDRQFPQPYMENTTLHVSQERKSVLLEERFTRAFSSVKKSRMMSSPLGLTWKEWVGSIGSMRTQLWYSWALFLLRLWTNSSVTKVNPHSLFPWRNFHKKDHVRS